ncbi:MAG: hypothetical protein ACOYOT_02215 [Bacteroidales bacterium]
MNSKEKYISICKQYKIPLFSQHWWMDCVCGKNWEVLIYEEDGQLLATMIFFSHKKLGLRLIVQPFFTQSNGIWLNYPLVTNPTEKFELEGKVSNYFFNELNKIKVDYFQQSFHYKLTNYSSFRWKSFNQNIRYTYVIEDISNIELVEHNFSKAKKKHLAKSKDLVLIDSVSSNQFYEHHKRTLKSKGINIVYSYEMFEKMHNEALLRNQGKIIALGDKNKIIYAALFIIWDSESAYNLISTIDTSFRNSGASTRVVLEAIRFVSDKTKVFDFEGSMIPEVANSFKQFGTTKKPYLQLEKKSTIYSLIENIRTLIGWNFHK